MLFIYALILLLISGCGKSNELIEDLSVNEVSLASIEDQKIEEIVEAEETIPSEVIKEGLLPPGEVISNEDAYNYLKELAADTQFEVYEDSARNNYDSFCMTLVKSCEENDSFANGEGIFFLPMIDYRSEKDSIRFDSILCLEIPTTLGAGACAEEVLIQNDRNESLSLPSQMSMSNNKHLKIWLYSTSVGTVAGELKNNPIYETQYELSDILEGANLVNVLVGLMGEENYTLSLTDDDMLYLRQADSLSIKMLEKGFLY